MNFYINGYYDFFSRGLVVSINKSKDTVVLCHNHDNSLVIADSRQMVSFRLEHDLGGGGGGVDFR